MQSHPEEADRVRARAQDERNRSRDATVAKLLNARTAVRPKPSRSVLQASAQQALIEDPDNAAEEHPEMHEPNPDSTGHVTHSRETSMQDMIVLESSEFGDEHQDLDSGLAMLEHPDDSTRHAPWTSEGHRPPAQHCVLIQARQQAQGMILSLQDTVLTLGALTQHIPER